MPWKVGKSNVYRCWALWTVAHLPSHPHSPLVASFSTTTITAGGRTLLAQKYYPHHFSGHRTNRKHCRVSFLHTHANDANDTMPKPSKKSSSAISGIMMILSPAKTLNLDVLPPKASNIPPEDSFTLPDCNPDKTKQVAEAMKKNSAKGLGKLLGISDNLAKTSHQYWKDFDASQRPVEETKPSIYSFSGAAYQGIQALECSSQAILYMQANLRIVDGVYGLLRPLDRMQAYRLEMATRNIFGKDNDQELPSKLNEYWKPSITQRLASELETRPQPILLNLASDEYAAGVDAKELQNLVPNANFVKVAFKHQGRVIAVHAKRARGLMVRYLSEAQATTLEDVKSFDWEEYRFVEGASDDSTLVFDRTKAPGPKKAPAKTKKAPKTATAQKASATKRPRGATKAKAKKEENDDPENKRPTSRRRSTRKS